MTMRVLSKYLRLSVLLLSGLSFAAEPAPVFNSPDVTGDGNTFTWVSDGRKLMSSIVPVDPERSYILTGEFHADSTISGFSFGLELLNQKQTVIPPHSVRAVAGTETRLVKAAKKGDTSIFVEDASKWSMANGRVIALWAQPGMRDLPAKAFEFYIKSINQTGDKVWRIDFTRPMVYNIAAGRLVRQHSDAYNFSAVRSAKLNKTPRRFRHLISPGGRYTVDSRCWWPGVRHARIIMQAPAGSKIECRDVKLIPVSREKAAEIRKELSSRGEKLQPYGRCSLTGSGNEITAVPGSGFCISGLSWKTDDIKQLEMQVRSSQAGMLESSFYGTGTSGKAFRVTESRPVIPDGKYHWQMLSFSPPENISGTINELRLIWRSEFPANLEITDLRGLPQTNIIPAGAKLLPGKPVMLEYLMPRRKYRLEWIGGAGNPGMEIAISDRDGRELSRLQLPAGQNCQEFTVPGMAVRAALSVNAAAAGRPRLSLLPEPPPRQSWRGRWIWNQKESGPEWTNVWFKREFHIDGEVEQASLAIAADDYPQIWINGKLAGSGGSFITANCFDIKNFLRPGRNTVIIRVLNGTMNGGLLCDLFYRADGKDHYVSSGPEWKLHVGGKELPAEISAPVMTIGDIPEKTAPWAGRLDYRYAGPRNIMKILSTGKNHFTAELLTEEVEVPRFIRAKAVADDGSGRDIILDAGIRRNGNILTIRYPTLFSSSALPMKIYLTDDRISILNDLPVGEIPPSQAAPGLSKAEYADVGGRVRLMLDGREYSPVFWALNTSFNSNPGGQVELITEARDAGFRNFPLLIELPEFWLGPGKYDFSKVDMRAAALLDLCPDAIFLLQVGCWMPEWWLKANPDDVTAHANGSPLNRLESQALSSRKWLKDAEVPLKALVEHLKKSNYGRKIWGANVAENRNWEWFWTTNDANGRPAVAGYSPADLATFREMLRRKYRDNAALAAAWKDPQLTFDTARMPPPETHHRGRIGSLLDPEKDRQLMDWFEYRNLALAEAVIHLCRTLKTASGNKWLTGAYYGYFIEMAVNYGRPVHDHGHNGYLETAKSPYVDFVRAPTRYNLRKIGLADGIMLPQDTFTLHGKVVYTECDLRTSFRRTPGILENYVSHPATVNETISMMNRALGMRLATGTAHYWYDILRGSFREPVLLDLLREQNELCRKLPPVQNLTPREIAVVVDRDSSYFTKRNAPDGILPVTFGPLLWNLNRIGAAHRIMSIEDLLENTALPASRFYIMANSYALSREQRQKLMARFEAEKATVLWLYAPGAFYPEAGPRAEYCGDFLGLKTVMSTRVQAPVLRTMPPLPDIDGTVSNALAPWFYPVSGYERVLGRDANGQPVLVSLPHGRSSHIFSTLPVLPVEVLRHFAAAAGVHLYTRDAVDQIHVGNDVLFIHAVRGGKKSFILPAGTRLKGIIGPMKGRELASGEEWETEAAETNGFLLIR